MKLRNSWALLLDLRSAFQAALIPTIRAITRAPSLVFHPVQVSRLFMAHVWTLFGNGIDENSRGVKNALLVPNTRGVVLDIGAGHGHTVNYLNKQTVSKYVALEPNTYMHDEIRKTANAAGFTEESGNLLILGYGAEQTSLITSALGGPHSVDTIVSILTLCSVPDPEKTIQSLVEQVLKPGGQLLFYEHVLSQRDDVIWWQKFWTPLWKLTFDGCRLDRPTDKWIESSGVWADTDIHGLEGEDVEHLFWHRIGKLTKATATV